MPQFENKKLLLLKKHLAYFTLSLLVLFPLDITAKDVRTAQERPNAKTSKKERIYALSDKSIQSLSKNMVWVEAGSFTMGSDAPEARTRERPAHEVSLDGYYIAKYELTQDIFEELMGWNNSYFACANCPVNNISWFNMQLFIDRLNKATGKTFRLPTEAEWAFAAKGGIKSKSYTFSGSNDITEVAWFDKNANKRSHPVGLKKPNELGLYDMTGNLWEFCQDDMSRNAYQYTEKHNPFYGDKNNQKKKAMKVLRGSGYEFSAEESKIYIRDGATNNVRMPDIGFRLAMDKK